MLKFEESPTTSKKGVFSSEPIFKDNLKDSLIVFVLFCFVRVILLLISTCRLTTMFDDGYKYENVDMYLPIMIIKDDVHFNYILQMMQVIA